MSTPTLSPEWYTREEEGGQVSLLDLPDAPLLLLAGVEDDDGAEPHICRSID